MKTEYLDQIILRKGGSKQHMRFHNSIARKALGDSSISCPKCDMISWAETGCRDVECPCGTKFTTKVFYKQIFKYMQLTPC